MPSKSKALRPELCFRVKAFSFASNAISDALVSRLRMLAAQVGVFPLRFASGHPLFSAHPLSEVLRQP